MDGRAVRCLGLVEGVGVYSHLLFVLVLVLYNSSFPKRAVDTAVRLTINIIPETGRKSVEKTPFLKPLRFG